MLEKPTPHLSGHTDFPQASSTLVVCKHSGYDWATPGPGGSPKQAVGSRPWVFQLRRASLPAPGIGPRVQLMIKGGHSGSPGSGHQAALLPTGGGHCRGPHRSTLPSRPSKPFPTHFLTFPKSGESKAPVSLGGSGKCRQVTHCLPQDSRITSPVFC